MTPEEIIYLRMFSYGFWEGEEVQVDEELCEKEPILKPYIGKVGIIKETYTKFHAWAQGSVMGCIVDFNGEEVRTMCLYLRNSDRVLEAIKKSGYIVNKKGDLEKIN
jgi:hypothetical protein